MRLRPSDFLMFGFAVVCVAIIFADQGNEVAGALVGAVGSTMMLIGAVSWGVVLGLATDRKRQAETRR